MKTRPARTLLPTVALAAALALAGCSDSTDPGAATAAPSSGIGEPAPLAVTSPDFTDGGAIDARFSANAYGGQCTGENINPGLSWSGAPGGTASFAITMTDADADGFVHWVHVGIPATVTSVDTGALATLPGTPGRTQGPVDGYFGPCAPSGSHHYVVTVWAFDAAWPDGTLATYQAVTRLAADHLVASGSIVAVYTP